MNILIPQKIGLNAHSSWIWKVEKYFKNLWSYSMLGIFYFIKNIQKRKHCLVSFLIDCLLLIKGMILQQKFIAIILYKTRRTKDKTPSMPRLHSIYKCTGCPRKSEKSNHHVWYKNKVEFLFLAHQLRGICRGY